MASAVSTCEEKKEITFVILPSYDILAALVRYGKVIQLQAHPRMRKTDNTRLRLLSAQMNLESMVGKLFNYIGHSSPVLTFWIYRLFEPLLSSSTAPQTKHLQFQWLQV